jgi:serine/threonine-protein kinase
MAPELIEGKPLDFRTDVFSVGIMLYQLTTGVLPFSGRNPHEVLKRIAEGRFTDPRSLNGLVSDGLARIIARALARRPEDRYVSIVALVDDLREFVAAAGFDNVRDELGRFFGDPRAYEQGLRGRMAAALAKSGKQQKASGHVARALELWNRALALDPSNQEVATEVRRLQGGKRLRRGIAVVFGALGLASLSVFGLRLRSGEPPAPVGAPMDPAAASAAGPPPGGANPLPLPASAPLPLAEATSDAKQPGSPKGPDLIAPVEITRQRPLGRDVLGSRRERPVAPVASPGVAGSSEKVPVGRAPAVPVREFRLGPTPKRVEVWLDGAKQFDYDLDHTTIGIPWDGTHVLEFRSRYCVTVRMTLGPGHPLPNGDQIIAQLQWKDAFLTVKFDPPRPGVRIIITEPESRQKANPLRLTPDPGIKMPIRFDPSDESRKTLDVTVTVGEKTLQKSAVVTAGESQTLVVELGP